MDNLFEELYNNIIKEENIDEEICYICHYKTTKNKIKLDCNHFFHRDCLKNLKYCPYCSKNINPDILKKKLCPVISKCKIILKSGKNKGKECGRNNCLIHKSKNICKSILKSGKNKGNECGRLNCGIHKLNININI